MSAAPRLQLKQSSGWFAAGQEVREAALLLSDSAFKLFIWVCLEADRSSGAIQATIADLASALGKTQVQTADLVRELTETGVCRWQAHGTLEIEDRFWPYARVRSEATTECSTYVATVKRTLLRHRCVQCAFTAADEKLAIAWHRRGIPLDQVERAILLGTLRKYVALLNRGGGSPITTLHYFKSLLEEAGTIENSADYWRYLGDRLTDLEQRWTNSHRQRDPAGHSETK